MLWRHTISFAPRMPEERSGVIHLVDWASTFVQNMQVRGPVTFSILPEGRRAYDRVLPTRLLDLLKLARLHRQSGPRNEQSSSTTSTMSSKLLYMGVGAIRMTSGSLASTTTPRPASSCSSAVGSPGTLSDN